MMATARYLGGVTRQDEADGGTLLRPLSIGVLHTTEGKSWPDYDGTAPHLTVDLTSRQVRQHVPFDRAARALRNTPGGVETNRAGCLQVEIIGTCDVKLAVHNGLRYLPAATLEELEWFGGVLAALHLATGVELTTTVDWRDYRGGAVGGSYGASNGLRLDAERWAEYTGWLGHCHVPENTHGDPGSFDIHTALQYASRMITAPPPVITGSGTSTQGSPVPRETVNPLSDVRLPAWSLPPGHWYGEESRDRRVHSGYWPADRPAIRQALDALVARGWRSVPNGDRYTGDVGDLVQRYQQDTGTLRPDRKLGPQTWASIAQSPIR